MTPFDVSLSSFVVLHNGVPNGRLAR
jgi:hypothetical protein